MARIDVFNGDADGICALHQLRLSDPAEATLITGAKREIDLLARVQAQPGDRLTVCDISVDVNSAALSGLLARGVHVLYFDHHAATLQPQHANLHAVIDVSPDVCTSALVDQYLGGVHRPWAVAAAFGDGLPALAQDLAQALPGGAAQLSQLRELGELINYNAYGDSVEDLFVHPAQLYQRIAPHAQPWSFLADEGQLIARIRAGRTADQQHARELRAVYAQPGGAIYLLPDAPWSRRLRGDFSHEIAQHEPQQAHAVLSLNARGGYTVSVRAPLARKAGADVLCKQFAGGGGRAAAAGINHLDVSRVDEFAAKFFAAFARRDA